MGAINQFNISEDFRSQCDVTKWALNRIDGFDFYGQSPSISGIRTFSSGASNSNTLAWASFCWISHSKKNFCENALLNIDAIPVALRGKCLRKTCLFTLQVIFTCFIIFMKHWKKEFIFLCFYPIDSRKFVRARFLGVHSLLRMRS